MIFSNSRVVFLVLFPAIIFLLLILRFLSRTSLLSILAKSWRESITDRFHVYQYYKVFQFNQERSLHESRLYRSVSIYLNSLSSLDDSESVDLFSGTKPTDIFFQLGSNQTVLDSFLGANFTWTNHKYTKEEIGQDGGSSFVLKLKKKDKRRVFRQYLQHILSVADEIEQQKKDIKLHINVTAGAGRWKVVPFTHPASFDSVVMDADLKNMVKSDLEQFLKSKQYFQKLGRVWKRSYLLHGPRGTGKTSFVAAMAKMLSYDVYEIDMSSIKDDTDLKLTLLQTTPKSLIVVEDLDRFLRLCGKTSSGGGGITLPGMLNFMDGMLSSCVEEQVMVFTMSSKDGVDEAVLRPGRIDVHVEFRLCDFSAFKSLAASYLGVKDHKLFGEVEEIIQSGASLSPVEIGEVMISNRKSPTRALKTLISALHKEKQMNELRVSSLMKRSGSRSSVEEGSSEEFKSGVFCRESIQTVREFGNLYGLLRMGSRRKDESLHSNALSAA